MIRGIFIINNHGSSRLTKCYDKLKAEDEQQTVRELYSLLSKRSDAVCNFISGGSLTHFAKTCKVVYRHYATLYFVFIVDEQESELGILDLVQVFVETLDTYFENVCELDLIFHSDKTHAILDEIVMGGMVLETSAVEIMAALGEMDKLAKSTRAAAVKA